MGQEGSGRQYKRRFEKQTRAERWCTAGGILFFLLFVCSVFMMGKGWIQGKREQAAFEKLSVFVTDLQTETSPSLPQSQPQIQKEQEYTAYYELYQKNTDFAAWLAIPGTKIHYPVMQTPLEPEYYLYRAFDKSDSSSGTPFIGEGGNLDRDVCIIYGHNMKNGTMFGELDAYANEEFFRENPVFSITTIEEAREYEVFAAVETRVLYQGEEGFRYYDYAGDQSEEEFCELIGWLRKNALYDTEITPSYGEQIVMLSTCSYHSDLGRFVVAARRKCGQGEKQPVTSARGE